MFGAATRHRLGNEVGTVSNSQIVSYEKERKEDYFRWRRDLSIDTGRPYKCSALYVFPLKKNTILSDGLMKISSTAVGLTP